MFSASGILGTNFAAMSHALDGLTMRQRAHAENLANVDTPGYQARTVAFESSLQAALDRANGPSSGITLPMMADGAALPGAIDTGLTGGILGSMQKSSDGTFTRPELQVTTTGEGVDRISETTGMMEDMIRYRVLSQQVTNKISSLKTLISEMGRS